MTHFKRRQFLAGMSAAAGAFALPGRGSTEPSTSTCRTIVVGAGGGWDTSYALDPKPGLSTVDAPQGDVRMFGGLPVFVHENRPAVTAFFEAWGSSSVVINGVDVRSIAHTTCAERVYTGYTGTKRPDLGAIVGHELGRDRPMPYLVLGAVGFAGDLSVSTGRVGAVNQIGALLPAGELALPTTDEFSHDGFETTGEDRQRIRNFLDRRLERERTERGALGTNRRRIDDFAEALSKSDAVRAKATAFGEFGFGFTLEQQVDFAVRAFRQDLAWTASLDSGMDWDTHGINEFQANNHEVLFAGLRYLAEQLAATPGSRGGTLLDETIVVVASEMSRTPKLNASGGKDHWPVTSTLLFGGPIRGGRALGGTNDLVEMQPVDYETGAISEQGLPLEPRNIMAGVVEAAGADPSLYFEDVEVFRAPFV